MSPKPIHSLFDYLQFAKQYEGHQAITDALEIIKAFNNPMNSMLCLSPVIYLYDYVADKYIFVNEALNNMGLKPNWLIDGSIMDMANILNKADLNIYMTNVFPNVLANFQKIPVHQHKEYVYSFNYRIKNKMTNNIQCFMEKCMIIHSTPEGLPLLALGFSYDITDIKSDTKVVHSLYHVDLKSNTQQLIEKKFFFPSEKDGNLSTREIEIVKWICEGLSSHQIADKLNISIYTLNNHRKNILQKTNCKNVAELFRFAINNEWV